MTFTKAGRILAGVVMVATAAPALAQPYSIPWSTVDGGGHAAITGGSFSLRGTIGQPDASGPLTGGVYSVSGGFWVSSAVDPSPAISISDAGLLEGSAGTANAVFTVTLSFVAVSPVSVDYATADLSAVSGSDYASTTGTLTFAPGEVSKQIPVVVNGDTLLESDETFKVLLSNPDHATILDDTGVGTITNDDGAPPSRVFVAGTGSDANICSNQLTPCRSLTASISQVAVNGEVIVLTPAEYDASASFILIGKGLKITSPSGTVAFVRARFVVDAVGGSVVLRGLTLKGNGALTGITLLNATSLSIEETTVDAWQNGVSLSGNSGAVSITNSVFANNLNAGVVVNAATARLAVNASRFESSSGLGLSAQAGGSITTVRDSSFTAGSGTAIQAADGSIDVQQSLILHSATGISVSGGTLRVSGSLLFGNGVGINVSGGTAQSFGNNVLRKNTTDVIGALAPISQQ